MGTYIKQYTIPSEQVLRRERSAWLTIAAAAISSGKAPRKAIQIADDFTECLLADFKACPLVDCPPAARPWLIDEVAPRHPKPPENEDVAAAERAHALLSVGIVEHDA
jgi:hypothetical protein